MDRFSQGLNRLNRRNFLCGAAALGLWGCRGEASAPEYSALTVPEAPLFKGRDFAVGVSLESRYIKNPDYDRLVRRYFNQASHGYEGQLPELQPKPGVYDWQGFDAITDYTASHNIRLHGHALIWRELTPQWLADQAHDRLRFTTSVKDHIFKTVGRVRGQIRGWDVVNEALKPDGGTLEPCAFLDVMGSDYVRMAFDWAHEADPDALLFLNDYALEDYPNKRDGLLRLIERLQKTNTPIHGIGTQTHTSLRTPVERIAKTLDMLAATGLKVHISELDISLNPDRDQSYIVQPQHIRDQATHMKEIVSAYAGLPASAKYAITLWGLSDGVSYMKSWAPQARPDAPVLFDEQWQPKPAFYAFLAA